MKSVLRSLFYLSLPITALVTFKPVGKVKAQQIVEDNTVGTKVTRDLKIKGVESDRIDGGTTRGGNLFHSFEKFNVEQGRGAYFSNPQGINNIITRVTGGKLSNISGTLGVLGNANLFLINPAGIEFGPNARLDVGGSFFASTADSLLFDNGFEFSASNSQAPPLLTINTPIGLRFRDNPGNIDINNNQSTEFRVPSEKTLGLVGGNINFDGGKIRAPGVKVEIGGLTAPGTVGIGSDGSLSFPADVALGDVSLSNQAGVDVTSGGGGSVTIDSRNLEMSEGSEIVVGIGQGLGTRDSRAGDININATDTVTIDGTNSTTSSTQILNAVSENSTGNAGKITVNAGSVNLKGNALIASVSGGEGDSGSTIVNAENDVRLSGSGSAILSSVGNAGMGNGGDININVTNGSFSLSDGAFLDASTFGKGNSGNIEINASSISLVNSSEIRAFTRGEGDAGNVTLQTDNGNISLTDNSNIFSTVEPGTNSATITPRNGGKIDVTTKNLTLTDGSQLLTEVRSGQQGNAGDITIEASGDVSFSGFHNPNTDGMQGLFGSGALSIIGEGAQGKGGDINITAKNFSLADNAAIEAGTLGRGNAGNIDINASSISLANDSEISASTLGEGDAGNVILRTDNGNISLDNSAVFSTVNPGTDSATITPRNGGKVEITTKNLTLNRGSQLLTEVRPGQQGNAGDIIIDASGNVSFSGFDDTNTDGTQKFLLSGVFSSLGEGAEGRGGDINITAKNLSLSDSGAIEASTLGRGNAGNIDINVSGDVDISGFNIFNNQLFSAAITSQVGPNVEQGNGGDIKIKAGSLDVNDFGGISNSTFGQGNAGNITLFVDGAISLANASQIKSIIEAGGEGIAGDINIKGRSLTLTGSSQIEAFVSGETNSISPGRGKAGSIDIQTTDFVDISGVGSVQLPITDFSDPSKIIPTAGFSSGLFTEADTGTTATAPQAAGNISVTTGDFRIADGAVVNALTSNSGAGGDIKINAKTFNAIGGGQVITTTRGSGNAGNITLNISDRLTIRGSDPNFNQRLEEAAKFDVPTDIVQNQGAGSGIFANTSSDSTGNGGSIFIDPRQVRIEDGGTIAVTSAGMGEAGKIQLDADNLTLDRGTIAAQSSAASGGDINLNIKDLLLLRRNSQISATAGMGQGAGDGGNIDINTDLLVGFPKENSDITANAFDGTGGKVNIQAESIFGIEPLSRADLQRLLNTTDPNLLDPSRLPSSDITAISQENPSLSGQVNVTTPDVDPSGDLVELPENVIDPEEQLAQNPCKQGVGSQFVQVGRGGLPTKPNQNLNGSTVRVDLVNPVYSTTNSHKKANSHKKINSYKPSNSTPKRIVPAQGWILNQKGEVVLTSYDPTDINAQRVSQTHNICSGR